MSVGSIEYSGLINQVPDTKASTEELKGIHQSQLATIDSQHQEEKQDTVIETEQAHAEIKDKPKERGHASSFQRKSDECDVEDDAEREYFIVEDDDKGQHFDMSV